MFSFFPLQEIEQVYRNTATLEAKKQHGHSSLPTPLYILRKKKGEKFNTPHPQNRYAIVLTFFGRRPGRQGRRAEDPTGIAAQTQKTPPSRTPKRWVSMLFFRSIKTRHKECITTSKARQAQ